MMDLSALEQPVAADAASSAAAVSRALAALSDLDLLRLRACWPGLSSLLPLLLKLQQARKTRLPVLPLRLASFLLQQT